MAKVNISQDEVKKIAKLASLMVTDEETEKFAVQFSQTLEVIDGLNEIDTNGVEPTAQVTGQMNVLREDVVDEKRMFSQAQALAGAKRSHEGFFVVEKIIDKDE